MQFATMLREGFIRWALRIRPPEPAPIVLGQRRVYVLPTRAGLGYATALLTMLLGSINYNLGLGYALTFLLAGLGIVAILQSFRNLVRIAIRPGRSPPVFAGEPATFHLVLASDIERRALRLWLPDGNATSVTVAAGATADCLLQAPTRQRGWLALPRVGIETTWPLGLIRAWSYCVPDARCLVYPKPAAKAPPLPWATSGSAGPRGGGRGLDDFAGLRSHQPADSPRQVAWKVAARHDDDMPLLTKQFEGRAIARVWLDWETTSGSNVETRLAILTRWVLDAHAAGIAFGLSLPGKRLAPASGSAHLHAVLSALALHGQV